MVVVVVVVVVVRIVLNIVAVDSATGIVVGNVLGVVGSGVVEQVTEKEWHGGASSHWGNCCSFGVGIVPNLVDWALNLSPLLLFF